MTQTTPAELSRRKRDVYDNAQATAEERARWIARHHYFYAEDLRYMRFLIPEGSRVLDLGCGAGALLAGLKPSYGAGVDFAPAMIAQAKADHPEHDWVEADVETLDAAPGEAPYDAIVLSDTLGVMDDCLATLQRVRGFCAPETRLVVAHYARLWEPAFALAAKLGLKQSIPPQNWLTVADIENLLALADFEIVKRERRILSPYRLFGLGRFVNRFIATLPVIRALSLRSYIVARRRGTPRRLSASVLVPCRNERGNVEAAVTRTPPLCDDLEIVFVEGGSSDGTWDEIQRVIAAYPDRRIRALKQPGKGKGDAVRAGFAAAEKDALFILDADLTMPPEDLPKYYDALASGKGEFVNGTRLVYPLEKEAMRPLNFIANHIFSWIFSYLLNQRFTDTLCGTKALLKKDYDRIAENRHYFGDFDPFGDFDLIFGAAKLNLKTVEIPIRYAARSYGETQISRFAHGWLLLRMVVFAFRKLKAL